MVTVPSAIAVRSTSQAAAAAVALAVVVVVVLLLVEVSTTARAKTPIKTRHRWRRVGAPAETGAAMTPRGLVVTVEQQEEALPAWGVDGRDMVLRWCRRALGSASVVVLSAHLER